LAADADLIHGNVVALARTRGGNVLGCGDEYLDTVLADEAVEGREPFCVLGQGKGKVIHGRIGRRRARQLKLLILVLMFGNLRLHLALMERLPRKIRIAASRLMLW
jgi:hypothetical protein